MKKIYLIRHGATEGNENNRSQPSTIPLSETGSQQARLVAERFKTIPVDIIITSDMVRAAQTADVIGNTLDKKIISTNLFREIQWPFEVGTSPNQGGTPLSDEENFIEIKKIAHEALAYISSLAEENILMVTHGNFLVLLLTVMGLGDTCTIQQYNKLQEFFIAKNTGVTTVKENKGTYSLVTWNDYTHLG